MHFDDFRTEAFWCCLTALIFKICFHFLIVCISRVNVVLKIGLIFLAFYNLLPLIGSSM